MTRVLLVGEALAALAAVLGLLGHAGWQLVRSRSRGAAVQAASRALADALSMDAPAPAALRQLSGSERLQLLLATASALGGSQQDRLRRIAAELGLTAIARRRCRSRLWWRRLAGARLLTAFGGGETEMLALLLDDREEVRAQAVEWVGEHPSDAAVDHLLDLLTDRATLCRFAVKQSLLRLGATAAPAILLRLESAGAPTVELLEVACWSVQPSYLEPARRLTRAPDAAVRAAALRLLGALGGAAVAEPAILALSDPAAQVRAAGADALGRVGHWPAATGLGGLLRDPSWDVRRAAGLALERMGAPGRLVLHRALSDRDDFAADMARLVLDVADSTAAPP